MLEALTKSLGNALKSGLWAATIWTCSFSAILWFFSKPAIPYFNFIQILAPYSFAFFGLAALIFEALTHWLSTDDMKYGRS